MSVYDLNHSQLDCLRWAMFYEDGNDEVLQGVETPLDVTDDMVYSHYEGINFVVDDFS